MSHDEVVHGVCRACSRYGQLSREDRVCVDLVLSVPLRPGRCVKSASRPAAARSRSALERAS